MSREPSEAMVERLKAMRRQQSPAANILMAPAVLDQIIAALSDAKTFNDGLQAAAEVARDYEYPRRTESDIVPSEYANEASDEIKRRILALRTDKEG